VPFYAAMAETASAPNIQAPLLVQHAETAERINVLWPAFEAALQRGAGHNCLGPHDGVLQEESGPRADRAGTRQDTSRGGSSA